MKFLPQKYICCFGEVLWDTLPSSRTPGGAPMNVAFHLENLGVKTAMISKVGSDELGNEIRSIILHRISGQWIQTDKQYPTGIVKLDVSDPKKVSYEIVRPAAWDHIEFNAEAAEISRDAYAIVYGTLACRHKTSRETLLSLLEKTKAIKIFDINLRAPDYSREVVLSLLKKSEIVKMNQEELETINSWVGQTHSSVESKIRHIKDKFNLKKILVTMGSDGAFLIDENGLSKSEIYPVQVKDTIGCGDAFLAGIIKNMIHGVTSPEMLRYACALGSLVASHQGATPKILEQDIINLMSGKS